MKNKSRTENRAEIFVGLIVAIALLGMILNFNFNKLINFVLPLGISFILTGLSGDLLEELTGDFFKKRHMSFKIKRHRINVPMFLILTIIIKIWLF